MRVKRAVEFLASVQMDIAAISVGLILLQVTLDLLLRNFFGTSIGSSPDIVAYYYMPALAFLPLLSLEYLDEHIATDVFFSRFPPRVQTALLTAGSVLILLLYIALLWFSVLSALAATANREVVVGADLLPVWPVRWLLPIAFLTAALGALLTMLRRLAGRPTQVLPGELS
jgi:TRAP-type C4-dicarboxylate transport system permease small subunit